MRAVFRAKLYTKYLLRHKFYVAIECFRHGLYWRGLVHDLSKFTPGEFVPYMNWFYGNEEDDEILKEFDFAWLRHQHRNEHYWQYWRLQYDNGEVKYLRIPDKVILEMVADWKGASRVITGSWDIREWFHSNRARIASGVGEENMRRITAVILAE